MRNYLILTTVGALMAAAEPAHAQSHGGHAQGQTGSSYAALASRSVKALSDEQIADLRAAKGMGYALAAELNGYPGPMHVLQLADQLNLSPAQRSELETQVAAMKREASALGEDVITLETELDRLFVSRSVTPTSLQQVSEKIGQKQAALRVAHLKYHLSSAASLSAGQVQHYNVLRGYNGAQVGHGVHKP
jgi:Heavy-metal resistance